ncbi:MAG: hypothetical protein Devi2KO_34930 [Devosia indica]
MPKKCVPFVGMTGDIPEQVGTFIAAKLGVDNRQADSAAKPKNVRMKFPNLCAAAREKHSIKNV